MSNNNVENNCQGVFKHQRRQLQCNIVLKNYQVMCNIYYTVSCIYDNIYDEHYKYKKIYSTTVFIWKAKFTS